MRPLDWLVLVVSLVFIVAYGLWRGRDSNSVDKYLLAGKTMPWYAMALSIMATQASAITFISGTAQSYVDGMRFIQMYFGLPIAMVILSATAVPLFHRSGVYTAYEYLEKRFDAKTRTLVSIVFLLQRGLACGVALYAPAVVLTVILGVPDRVTTLLMGGLVLLYTVAGGIQAVTWTDFQQMLIMFAGVFISLLTAVLLLPGDTTLPDALALAGAAGRLNPVVLSFDWNDQFNIWTGLLGGTFLALAYFGTDQSQVQRYLTGKSVNESRLSLLFNAIAKVPMQFFILLTGAMVFVFFSFEKPPVVFNPVALERLQQKPEYPALAARYDAAFEERRAAASRYLRSKDWTDLEEYRSANKRMEAVRKQTGANDTNYIFLSFVTKYLPVGVVGVIMAAIFAAAMSTISAEVNSLATVSVIDIYRRHLKRDASDRHYLNASRLFTAFWCAYAITTAQFGSSLDSLIVAVNRLGSYFYGGMLGVFALAFYFPRVGPNAAFIAVIAGEAAIFATSYLTNISFLWYNVVGAVVVVVTGLVLSVIFPEKGRYDGSGALQADRL
jgi:SSS family transporter